MTKQFFKNPSKISQSREIDRYQCDVPWISEWKALCLNCVTPSPFQVVEKIAYSEKRNIAFMYEKDGTVTVNDYSKVRRLRDTL